MEEEVPILYQMYPALALQPNVFNVPSIRAYRPRLYMPSSSFPLMLQAT